MDPGHRGWPPPPGGNPHPNAEQNQSQAARPPFGTGQQSPPQGHSLPPPPPPSGPFPHFHQPPSLASLAGLSQSSPRQPTRQDGPPQPPPQSQQLPLPGFSQATGQLGAVERERERAREAETHIKEEEDRRHREQQDRQRFEQAPPHQTQAGPPMLLHQPVAVGPRSSVHGPNGLLANPGPQSSLQLGAPSGPANIFAGGPVQPSAQPQGPSVQQIQAGMLMPLPQSAAQQGGQGGQGQQPILNDALGYLDQVKVQFADRPDVYNRFLDIMKDFKSGAIDTPGVIGRVSTLFAGNPELIQGFNTFLPPGYRIECGPGNDPNAIRVTTPMGSSILPMPQPPRSHADQDMEQDGLRPPNGTTTPQPGQFAGRALSPSGRALAQPQVPHHAAVEAARQQEQQQVMHQQEQRGVNSLSNAVSAAAGGAALRAGVSPRGTPLPGQQDPNAPGDGLQGPMGMEKRGPVEFNHAISYVNKIKTRYALHPDIYKQFLEILQTYQRESKPIQDVYSQVTRLFDGAPDLLEDFKQFLPESAAQAKAAEMSRRQGEEQYMLSNVRAEPMHPSPVMSAQLGTPNHPRSNLPPVGNFAPTPVGKENNKKRKERQGTIGSANDAGIGPSTGRGGAYGNQQVKRQKQVHQPGVRGPNDAPPTSPSLIPRMPEPLPPNTSTAPTHEELSFFDRAKKAIGNKIVMNEFLKLCNLFSQDYIDRATLIHRSRPYIGQNPELMKWFSEFIGYDEKDVIIENKLREPVVPGGRVSLSNCRGLGPSYRLLPKRERIKTCSGRDELCNAVLNDEWASHPTWASEDSGFVAHRKNLHEEGLHRIEEERHDYDYNIEAANRTIQLLEPFAASLSRMSQEELQTYALPPKLGAQSESISKRVFMKLYGRERGSEVYANMYKNPGQVVPVLLNRLKERLETWKLAQREWEKVWRDQTQKMFWKSLDHQGFDQKKNNNPRMFTTKYLQTEMATLFEEMKKNEEKTKSGLMRGKAQSELRIDDVDVVVDVVWLMLVYVRTQDSSDTPRLEPFLKEFFATLLGLDQEMFDKKLAECSGGTPINGESAFLDDNMSGAEDSAGEKRGKKNGKTTLLRQTLDKGSKGKKMSRKDREDSNTSASRASTPDVASHAGDEMTDGMAVDTADTPDGSSTNNAAGVAQPNRWFEHPPTETSSSSKKIDPNEPQERDSYRLWANVPIFSFVRVFMIMYERLHKLKLAEEQCRTTVANAKQHKPAYELGIGDKLPQDFFGDIGPNANYYKQMLSKFASVLEGDLDFVNDGVEDCLRRFYLNCGFLLYPLEKMVQTCVKYGVQIVAQDSGSKDRSWDIVQLWKKDRVKNETSAVQSTDYRKAAEKLIGGGDQYRIEWNESLKAVQIFLVKKDDPFYVDDFPSSADFEDQWRYYVASYSSLDDTEGVDKAMLAPVLLKRNISALDIDPTADTFPPFNIQEGPDGTSEPTPLQKALASRVMNRFDLAHTDENLTMRIALGTYRRIFQPGSSEGFYEEMTERMGGAEVVREAEEARELRAEGVKEKFEDVNGAMKDVGREVVEKAKQGWMRVVDGTEGRGEEMEVDG